jgi:hypothetical protein
MSDTKVIEAEVVSSDEKPWLWKPGQSGNPNGRPKKGKAFSEEIEKQIHDVHPFEAQLAAKEGREPRPSLQVIVEKVMRAAMLGEPWAIAFLALRLDGKPLATHQVDGQVDVLHGPMTKMTEILQRFQDVKRPKTLPEPTE